MLPLPPNFVWTWISKYLRLSMLCTLHYQNVVSCKRSQWVTNSVCVWPFEPIPNAQLAITKTVRSLWLLVDNATSHMICSILYLLRWVCPRIQFKSSGAMPLCHRLYQLGKANGRTLNRKCLPGSKAGINKQKCQLREEKAEWNCPNNASSLRVMRDV